MYILQSQLVNGIFAASVLLLCALGMVVIFGNMNVVNLAHGEFIMAGAYTAYFFTETFALPFILAAVLAFVVAGGLGMLVEKVVIKRFYSRFEETLLATYAISVILSQAARLIFSSTKKSVDIPAGGSVNLGRLTFPAYQFIIVGVTVLIVAAICLLFYRTTFGKKVRAIKQNRQMAECLGVDTSMFDTLSFGLGCALAGLSGAIIAPIKVVSPTMGSAYLMDSFSTVVVGGVDSFLGTSFSAGLISESTSVLSGFMNEIYAQIIVLIGIILILRFRPQGLLAKERR